MRLRLGRVVPFIGALVAPVAAAQRLLQSTSLNTCQENSGFSASKFDVVFTPNNDTAAVNMVASSTIEANVLFDITILAYGYEIIHDIIDPCNVGLAGFCPMTSGYTGTPFNLPISASAAKQIPSIAYTFPDLDATVKIYINASDTGESLACVEAGISNSQTVDLLGVKWAAALVVGLALLSSAIISGLGHSNAASHIAANAVSLCGYFQAQAMIGLTGITLPPVVQSWTQDFQWSIGIVRIGFMQTIFTWYQRATGGTPSTLFNSLSTVSVQVEKRSLPVISPAVGLARRAIAAMPNFAHATSNLMKRGNIVTSSGSYVVYGIQRVAFRAEIESTNLFLTGLTFFCVTLVFTAIVVAAFKVFCELATKIRLMKGDTFLEFRNGWRTVVKGVLYRITLMGYPPVTILCLWEFTQNDSPAEMVLAVFFLLYTTAALGWAAWKIIQIARRSVALHKTPAYILFGDPHALSKWGFLYIQFRASAYYFVAPLIGYIFVKSLFISLAQNSGIAQAIGFIIIEAAALITASVVRPWMDKKQNSFNIYIAVVNFINAICLLIFTDVFGQPPLANGVVGVVFWLLNAITTLILLIFLIVTTLFVFFRENPDGRYRFMSDERASFMKSSQSLSAANQLDALASTARGEKVHGLDLDDDGNESGSVHSFPRHSLRPSTANSGSRSSYRESRTHAGPSVPFAPSSHLNPSVNGSVPPSPVRSKQNASPWQRGAGYD
ncbi:calcium spray protein [Xylariales sp. PMI_506]|nr:calcium spray protein [Xylariales sp. PMI_506]